MKFKKLDAKMINSWALPLVRSPTAPLGDAHSPENHQNNVLGDFPEMGGGDKY